MDKQKAIEAVYEARKGVSYDTREVNIECFMAKYDVDGIKHLANSAIASNVVEKILIGFPIDVIFVKEGDTPIDKRTFIKNAEIVASFAAFIKGEYCLENLKLVPELNGFYFKDLPSSLQRKIEYIHTFRFVLFDKCPEEML